MIMEYQTQTRDRKHGMILQHNMYVFGDDRPPVQQDAARLELTDLMKLATYLGVWQVAGVVTEQQRA